MSFSRDLESAERATLFFCIPALVLSLALLVFSLFI